jgi:hypothetical protein
MRPGERVVVVALLAAGLVLVAPFLPVGHLLRVFALVALVASPYLVKSGSQGDYLEPLKLVTLLYLLYFGVTSIGFESDPNLERALEISLVGCCALLLGHVLASRRVRAPAIGDVRAARVSLSRVTAVYCLGVAGVLFGISSGDFFGQFEPTHPWLAFYIGAVGIARFIAFGFLVGIALETRRRGMATWLALAAGCFEIALAFITSSKQLAIFPVIMVLLLRHHRGRRVGLATLGAVAVGALVVFSALYEVRTVLEDHISTGDAGFQGVASLAREIPRVLSEGGVQDLVERHGTEGALSRFHGIDSLTRILERGEPPGYEEYKGLRYLAGILIPRFMDPNKRAIDYQVMFGHEFAGIPAGLRVLIPPMRIGVFFLDFGILGVAIGELLFGMLGAYAYGMMRKAFHAHGWIIIPFYCYCLIELCKIETHPAEWLVGEVKNIPVLALVAVAILGKQRARAVGAVLLSRQPVRSPQAALEPG